MKTRVSDHLDVVDCGDVREYLSTLSSLLNTRLILRSHGFRGQQGRSAPARDRQRCASLAHKLAHRGRRKFSKGREVPS